MLLINYATGQNIISGRVYDSTKLYVVPGVIVKSTGGGSTITDSLGTYHINTNENDSISFYYANMPTGPLHKLNCNKWKLWLQKR